MVNYISLPNNKVGFFMQDIDVEAATVETRVKVLSQSGANYSLFLGIENPAGDAWLDLFPDHIAIDNGGPTFDINMTEYHILRVTRDDAGKIAVYVDERQVLEGAIGGKSGRKDIIFGAGSTGGTSESFWDYVVYTTAGALSPNQLPNYASTVADDDVSGKLPIMWGK